MLACKVLMKCFIGSIPKELGNLTSVQVVDLSCNELTGTIPTQFANLNYLHYLDLSDNFLSGSVPDALCQLSCLESLRLCTNYQYGNTGCPRLLGIPLCLYDMPILKSIGNLTVLSGSVASRSPTKAVNNATDSTTATSTNSPLSFLYILVGIVAIVFSIFLYRRLYRIHAWWLFPGTADEESSSEDSNGSESIALYMGSTTLETALSETTARE